MNKIYAALACLLLSQAAFADDMMKKEKMETMDKPAMKPAAMHDDNMKKKEEVKPMRADANKKDSMKAKSMKPDAMAKDGM